jgi:sugar phosphate isomerase/epimerase
MIEFACHTWGFNDLTLPEALGTIARLGFRAADIGSGAHLNTAKAALDSRRIAADMASDLRAHNLTLTDIYLMLPHIADADAAKRQRDIDSFKALLPLLRASGTRGVTVSPGVRPNDAAADDAAPFERSCDALRQFIAAADGLPLSIEPHLDSVAADVPAALAILDAVEGLKITLDWAHFACAGVKLTEAARLLPHTRHVHIRQAARNKLQVPFEKGKLDLAQVMALLQESGYEGVVCIETMRTIGWRGMVEVNPVREAVLLRDALRAARIS